MSKTLALIHTVGELVPVYKALCAEMLPGVDCFHLLDEGIARLLNREGGITPRLAWLLTGLAVRAEEHGADLILVTCSSASPAVDDVRPQVCVPVLKIDEPMADLAVQSGERIGVLATSRSALAPVAALVESRARAAGRHVEVQTLFLEGALQSLQTGDATTHDRRVVEGIRQLARWAQVVVLAQGSMARALEGWPEAERPCPILTNARLGLQRVAQLLNG